MIESSTRNQSPKIKVLKSFLLVHVVGLAPTKSARTLDLQSRAFAAQPHMRNEFQISNLTSQDFRSEIRCAKKIDEGRENNAANTLRGTLLLTMATPGPLAKQQRRHPRCL